MTRKTTKITLDEISGNHFPDLDSAQRAALPHLAADLASTIRRMIAAGELPPIPRKE